MRVTLSNKFHNTETTLTTWNSVIDAQQYKRACKKLCGMKCACGKVTSVTDKEGNAYELEPCNYDGYDYDMRLVKMFESQI